MKLFGKKDESSNDGSSKKSEDSRKTNGSCSTCGGTNGFCKCSEFARKHWK